MGNSPQNEGTSIESVMHELPAVLKGTKNVETQESVTRFTYFSCT